MANFNLKRGRTAQTAAALAFAWLPLNFAGTAGGYTPPVGTCGFDRLTGGAIVDDPQTLFDLEPGSPPADATALAFAWGNRVVNFAGTAGGYRPQTGEVHFPPQYGRPLDFHGAAGGYTPPNYGGVRFGPAPKPSGTVDFATEAGGYYPPLALVDLPRDSTQQASWPPEPSPEIMQAFYTPWANAKPMARDLLLASRNGLARDVGRKARWGAGVAQDQDNALTWSQIPGKDNHVTLVMGHAQQLVDQHTTAIWNDPETREASAEVVWKTSGEARDAWSALLWDDPPPRQNDDVLVWDHSRVHPLQRNTDVVGLYVPPAADAVDFDLTGGFDFHGVAGGYVPQHGTVNFTGTTGAEPLPLGVDLVFEWGRLATAKEPGAEATDSSPRTTFVWHNAMPCDRAVALAWGRGSPSDGSPFLPWEVEEPEGTDPDEPVTIPSQRTYTVNSSATVVRLPERTPVNILATGAGLRRGDIAWSGSIAVADQAGMDLIKPGPGGNYEAEIEINGQAIWVIVERFRFREVFEQDGGTKRAWVADCRGISAELDDPYVVPRDYINTGTATAAQLAEAELAGTGWTITWPAGLDWPFAVGEFFYHQLTPLRAIKLLAATVGAFVRPSPDSKHLDIVSWLPWKPAQWAVQTPDAIVPQDIVVTIDRSYEPHPAYDQIQVTGGTQGVTVLATKAGTGGTNPEPNGIVDPFLLTTDVAQERARVELYRSGPYAMEPRQWPIIDPIGVRLPGELIRNVDEDINWYGLVDQIRLNGAWGSEGLACWMDITQERRDV